MDKLISFELYRKEVCPQMKAELYFRGYNLNHSAITGPKGTTSILVKFLSCVKMFNRAVSSLIDVIILATTVLSLRLYQAAPCEEFSISPILFRNNMNCISRINVINSDIILLNKNGNVAQHTHTHIQTIVYV